MMFRSMLALVDDGEVVALNTLDAEKNSSVMHYAVIIY